MKPPHQPFSNSSRCPPRLTRPVCTPPPPPIPPSHGAPRTTFSHRTATHLPCLACLPNRAVCLGGVTRNTHPHTTHNTRHSEVGRCWRPLVRWPIPTATATAGHPGAAAAGAWTSWGRRRKRSPPRTSGRPSPRPPPPRRPHRPTGQSRGSTISRYVRTLYVVRIFYVHMVRPAIFFSFPGCLSCYLVVRAWREKEGEGQGTCRLAGRLVCWLVGR